MTEINYLPDDIFKMILKMRGDEMRHDRDKNNFNKVINEINEINDKFKNNITPNEMTYDNNKDDVGDYVGNGCLLCDVFMCDLKNQDYYNFNVVENVLLCDDDYDDDLSVYDMGDMRFYKYHDIFNYMLYISSVNDNDYKY